MREQFIERHFKQTSLDIIAQANVIVAEYQRQGFKLTLRQLYYQFVARAIIPNKQSEYKRLGSIVNDGRLAGLIDWNAIEDRTRNLETVSSWRSPESIVQAVASQYKEDLWRTQPVRFEVWIEKEALVGVIEPICEELRLPYFACRGYTSQSETYGAGKRLADYKARGQKPIILHLGDHDPSGLDMTRDNEDRLSMFARRGIEVRRLALNMEQIEEHNPPPNPAKETDARFAGYQEEHGDESWELDALDPTLIASLIQDAVEAERDQDAWDAAEAEEISAREALQNISDNMPNVRRYLRFRSDTLEEHGVTLPDEDTTLDDILIEMESNAE